MFKNLDLLKQKLKNSLLQEKQNSQGKKSESQNETFKKNRITEQAKLTLTALLVTTLTLTFQQCSNPNQAPKTLAGSRTKLPSDRRGSASGATSGDSSDAVTGGSSGDGTSGGTSGGSSGSSSGGSTTGDDNQNPPPEDEIDCSGSGFDPGWSDDEWKNYFFNLVNENHLGAPTEDGLRSIQDEIESNGATLQHNSAGELRGRIYLPTGNPCDRWGRAVDVVTGWGESWTWIERF